MWARRCPEEATELRLSVVDAREVMLLKQLNGGHREWNRVMYEASAGEVAKYTRR